MSAILFILSQLLFQPLMAATFEVPVKEGDRLVLKGLEAQVLVVGQAGSSLRVSGVEDSSTEGVFVVTKKDNIIEVRMNEYSGKRSWLNILPKAGSQMKKIEISGVPVPLEAHLRGGSVVAQKWNKDLKVSLTQGRVSSLNGSGSLQIYVQKGDVNVQDHVGRVAADAYSGTMALRNIVGDVDATLFAGQLQIEKVRGFLSLATQQSNSKINQGSGTIQFENGKGTMNIQTFQGRMEGRNQDGTVTISMAMDSEVDVKSKSGRVSVQTPAGSGASLNLMTVEGEITVPSELRVTKLSAEKSVRGRLRGDAQRASVFVRSQEGTISVK
ncbi:DUF4097 family beta strand repeat-containing protein [Bdellovibrio sp. 22V]|uniref:DUF4097 family beta strand repeat-containing protein n=1 Tax=Bdellovibrio sp. 22V TaxID=3044166 RepID=UPI002543A807|nr:DUF4097 family beta strand repeat-containing protein [Bdellovibrio sp. 22V]WII71112.1 DUF4097 family beta strand repeat-containing protein [Bdellovibrio sp. 22V]